MEADMRIFAVSLLLLILAVSSLQAANCGGAIPCKCGDTVTSNYVMTTNLGPCSGHGLSLASGVTLDGNGYRISGPANGTDFYGVYVRGTTGGRSRTSSSPGSAMGSDCATPMAIRF